MEWQPIDSAPKDGSRFLGWFRDHADWCNWQESKYEGMPEGWRDGFITVYVDGSRNAPTHWLRVEPPK